MRLDMNVISTGTLDMTLKVVKLIAQKNGELSYGDVKLFIEKDPHHEVNNGIRLGLVEKEKDLVKLTKLGREYLDSFEEKKGEILREQSRKIKIIDICVTKLELKGSLGRKEIGDAWENLMNREYTEKTQFKHIEIIINWITALKFAEKLKNGTLKWKGN